MWFLPEGEPEKLMLNVGACMGPFHSYAQFGLKTIHMCSFCYRREYLLEGDPNESEQAIA